MRRAIIKLKEGKAMGVDEIPGRYGSMAQVR